MRIITLILFLAFVPLSMAQRGDFSAVDFTKADALAREYQGEDLRALPILVKKLTAPLNTNVEKFRAIYFWVSHNIRGEHHLALENDKMRRKFHEDTLALEQWNAGFKKEVFKLLVNKKETLCSGYTYLIQKMASLAGIEVAIVEGFGLMNKLKLEDQTIPNHSWNAVKLDGKWYLCDATWAAGYTDMNTYLFQFDYDDQYFLTDPSEFAKTHHPVDSQWALLPKGSIMETAQN